MSAKVLSEVIRCARFAAANGGPGPLSTGEALAAALALNRPDWLAERGYTLAEAIDRVGVEWVRCLPAAAKALADDVVAAEVVREGLAKAAVRPRASDDPKAPTQLDFSTALVTYGSAPGYRDATLIFDLVEIGAGRHRFRASLRIRPDDAESIVLHLRDVHRLAWRRPSAPLDVKPGETRPRWIDGSWRDD